MLHRYAPLILFFAILFTQISVAQVQINAAPTTTSTCANNGTITVLASSPNPPLVYSIIAGPLTQPVQTSNIFNSLPAGTYTLQVADAANSVATQQAVVPGNYLQPDFSPIVKRPYCAGGTDGRIIGNNISGTGKAPFTWQLIAPSPVTTAPQSSDTFSNLPAGNYTVRLTDACGSFRTIVATVADAPVSAMNLVADPFVYMNGCDTGSVYMLFQTTLLRFPLTCTYTTANGSFTITTPEQPDSTIFTGGFYSLEQGIPGLGYGDWVNVTITDNCGSVLILPAITSTPFNFCFTTSSYFQSCNYITLPVFDLNVGCNGFHNFTFFDPPVMYQVTDIATGAIVAEDTVDMASSGFVLSQLPYNTAYSIAILDGCGNSSSSTFSVTQDIQPPFIYSKDVFRDGCVDSSAFSFILVNNFRTEPILIFTSGPTYMGSTKPEYEYTNYHAYLDTFPVRGFGGTYHRFDIYGLSPGTYQFKVVDSCGNEIDDSLVVLPTAVTDFAHHFWYKKGCLGQNEIHYMLNNSSGTMNITNLATGAIVSSTIYYGTNGAPITDSIMNLPSGTYVMEYDYSFILFSDTQANGDPINCQVIRDTIVIEGYQTPEILLGNFIQCQSGIHLEVVPDSSKGVPPYQYEIISGPQTFPVQNSNLFDLNLPGVYVVRIYDICGNGSAAEITVEPITFPPISAMPFSCNSTSLTFGSSAYNTYTWTLPNGNTFTGDTLVINPITPADTGIYLIQQIVDINGCRDTFYTNYHLGLQSVNYINQTICEGDSVIFGTHVFNITGTYADTLTNINLCDSIVVLHLTVNSIRRDTINQVICSGSSYLFNGNVYTQAGIYYDTLSTNTCDSIVMLNLRVEQTKRDTLTHTLCEGQSFTVNSHQYTLTGVYHDTLSTVACDSIVVLYLTVHPLKRDTISHTICTGEAYTMNGQVYTQTGIYYDTLSTATCDSIITLNLTVEPPKRDSVTQSICTGETYILNGQVYSQTGIYYDTLSTATCDSIIVLNLTVNPVKRDTLVQAVCEGQSVTINGHQYVQTGIYHDTLSTSTCDSIVVLNLTVNPLIRDTLIRSVCEGNSVTVNGHVYSQTGIYHDTLSTTGCDSIVVLNLTVDPLKRDTLIRSVCEGASVTVNGHVYNQTGIYHDTLSTAGCDSIVVLNLTMNLIKRDTLIRAVCTGESITVNGHVYNQSGIYHDTLATNTCDSIVVLNLTVNPIKRDSVNQTICAGESVIINGHIYTQTGIYHDTLATSTCDSIVVLNLTVVPLKSSSFDQTICEGESYSFHNSVYSFPGDYSDTVATATCDSIVTLHLTVLPNPPVHITASATSVTEGDIIQLSVTPATSYQWSSPIALISIPVIQNPAATIFSSTWIYVSVTNNLNTCFARDSIYIVANKEPDPCKGVYIFMPGAFTPNGDGLNDVIRIRSRKITLERFSIFNRWGELVFETSDLGKTWDGSYKGEMIAGTYVYMISYRNGCDSEKHILKGSLVLIR